MRLPKNFNLMPKYIADDIYKKIGNKIAKDMSHAFTHSIVSFYKDYTPRVYKRKNRSYFFIDRDNPWKYTQYVVPDSNGKGFSVRVVVSAKNIKIPYRTTKRNTLGGSLNNIVFYNTFVLGQHGGKLPYKVLPKNQRPVILSNRWHRENGELKWFPPVMDEPPKAQMDDWFNDYVSGKRVLDNEINKIVVNSINQYLRNYNKQHGEE